MDVAVHDDPERLDRGDAQVVEPPQEPVLPTRQYLLDLLEGVQLAHLGHKTHHVAGRAAIADLDQPLVLPLLQRKVPGQAEQAGGHIGGGTENKPHGTNGLLLPGTRPSGPGETGAPVTS